MKLNISARFSINEERKLNARHHMALTSLKFSCLIDIQNLFILSQTRIS